MNILSIDAGSYSVKFLHFNIERKQFILLGAHEVVISEVESQLPPGLSLDEQHAEIIKSFLGEGFEGKTVQKIPNAYITSRYLTLPVTNRKKVQMMIPFQLDEHLPFLVSDAHFVTTFEKKGNNTQALVTITKNGEFGSLFDIYEKADVLPSVFTSELGIINSYAKHKNLKGPCAIVDIGHFTSKCYIIHESQVVSNHVSHTAGSLIDELISESYDIPSNEAIIYKHENCFFLTENQYHEVNEDQQEFAKLMKQAIWPLVLDLRRWILGFRVKYGVSLDTVYITGGTSRINNIDNFLSQALEVRVEDLMTTESVIDKDELLEGQKASFQVANLLSYTQMAKVKPNNFLTGPYSRGSGQELPLYSTSFLALRSLVVSLIIGVFFLVEFFIVSANTDTVRKKLTTLTKSPVLKFTNKERYPIKKFPEKFLRTVKKKSRVVKQEVRLIQSSSRINAITPLSTLSQMISVKEGISLSKFKSEDGLVNATFKAKSTDQITALEKSLKESNLPELTVEAKPGSRTLTLTFEAVE